MLLAHVGESRTGSFLEMELDTYRHAVEWLQFGTLASKATNVSQSLTLNLRLMLFC